MTLQKCRNAETDVGHPSTCVQADTHKHTYVRLNATGELNERRNMFQLNTGAVMGGLAQRSSPGKWVCVCVCGCLKETR